MSLSNIQHTYGVEQPAADVQPIPSPTPTQQVVQDANRVELCKDDLGRTLGVKRMNASTRLRVLKAMSAESADKGQVLFMSIIACSCVSIDGVPVAFPQTELGIDALIGRLEQEGLDAIGLCIATHFSSKKVDLKN
jgi:hypothetical protein